MFCALVRYCQLVDCGLQFASDQYKFPGSGFCFNFPPQVIALSFLTLQVRLIHLPLSSLDHDDIHNRSVDLSPSTSIAAPMGY
jgi:hypothetical protein